MKRITVLLAEDHTVVREGLWTLLEAKVNAFRKFRAKEKSSGTREKLAMLQSQRDCVFQPRVARNELPWGPGRMDFNPKGLGHVSAAAPQPRWGCLPSATFPRVARSSQPWALSRNPFGIHLWNFRKALRLKTISISTRRPPNAARQSCFRPDCCFVLPAFT